MRIIAGKNRGQRILGPPDASTTRPITDRIKTSLFDRLWALGLLPDDPHASPSGHVLDIFAGTGTLGLEALSRGSAHCTFVEQDRNALNRLNKNLATTHLEDRARILSTDALRPGWVRRNLTHPVRIAFVDPPYAMLRDHEPWQKLMPLLQALATAAEPAGTLILRTDKRLDAPAIPGWTGPDVRKISSGKLNWYFRPPDQP